MVFFNDYLLAYPITNPVPNLEKFVDLIVSKWPQEVQVTQQFELDVFVEVRFLILDFAR